MHCSLNFLFVSETSTPITSQIDITESAKKVDGLKDWVMATIAVLGSALFLVLSGIIVRYYIKKRRNARAGMYNIRNEMLTFLRHMHPFFYRTRLIRYI